MKVRPSSCSSVGSEPYTFLYNKESKSVYLVSAAEKVAKKVGIPKVLIMANNSFCFCWKKAELERSDLSIL